MLFFIFIGILNNLLFIWFFVCNLFNFCVFLIVFFLFSVRKDLIVGLVFLIVLYIFLIILDGLIFLFFIKVNKFLIDL